MSYVIPPTLGVGNFPPLPRDPCRASFLNSTDPIRTLLACLSRLLWVIRQGTDANTIGRAARRMNDYATPGRSL